MFNVCLIEPVCQAIDNIIESSGGERPRARAKVDLAKPVDWRPVCNKRRIGPNYCHSQLMSVVFICAFTHSCSSLTSNVALLK